MSIRYRCSLGKPFSDIQVVRVEWDSDEKPRGTDATDVWYRDGVARCCRCSGPLVGMSATCPHAKAAKRYVQKQARTP